MPLIAPGSLNREYTENRMRGITVIGELCEALPSPSNTPSAQPVQIFRKDTVEDAYWFEKGIVAGVFSAIAFHLLMEMFKK
jgi:hypothetical protein